FDGTHRKEPSDESLIQREKSVTIVTLFQWKVFKETRRISENSYTPAHHDPSSATPLVRSFVRLARLCAA
ncbi:hypothetical protein, partial [Klebsiella pneumoniae]|uniref:hypothetical protein n=1 Tax=Klebsiella pneumoniae TaxID=573 RepID=UPI003D3658D0